MQHYKIITTGFIGFGIAFAIGEKVMFAPFPYGATILGLILFNFETRLQFAPNTEPRIRCACWHPWYKENYFKLNNVSFNTFLNYLHSITHCSTIIETLPSKIDK